MNKQIADFLNRILQSQVSDVQIPSEQIGEGKEYHWRSSSVNHEPILIHGESGKAVAGAGKTDKEWEEHRTKTSEKSTSKLKEQSSIGKLVIPYKKERPSWFQQKEKEHLDLMHWRVDKAFEKNNTFYIEEMRKSGHKRVNNLLNKDYQTLRDLLSSGYDSQRMDENLDQLELIAEHENDNETLQKVKQARDILNDCIDVSMTIKPDWSDVSILVDLYSGDVNDVADAKEVLEKRVNAYSADFDNFNIKVRDIDKIHSKIRIAKAFGFSKSIVDKCQKVLDDYDKIRKNGIIAQGTKKEQPMNHQKADCGSSNPMYNATQEQILEMAKKDGVSAEKIGDCSIVDNNPYRINCQSSVLAYELRRRGYNVVVSPNYNDKTTKCTELATDAHAGGVYINSNGYGGSWDYENLDENAPKPKALVLNIFDALEGFAGNEVRCVLEWRWKGDKCGHIVMAIKDKDKSYFYDPQTNQTYGANDFCKLVGTGNNRQNHRVEHVRLMRIDDKEIDPYYIYGKQAVVRSVV